jgi:hypothetical protein
MKKKTTGFFHSPYKINRGCQKKIFLDFDWMSKTFLFQLSSQKMKEAKMIILFDIPILQLERHWRTLAERSRH